MVRLPGGRVSDISVLFLIQKQTETVRCLREFKFVLDRINTDLQSTLIGSCTPIYPPPPQKKKKHKLNVPVKSVFYLLPRNQRSIYDRSQPLQPQTRLCTSIPAGRHDVTQAGCFQSLLNLHGTCLQGRVASFISLCVICATRVSFDVALGTD